MKRKNFIILILTTIVTFVIGGQIRSIYGFDPPYVYYYSGLTIEYLSILAGLLVLVLLTINLIKKG